MLDRQLWPEEGPLLVAVSGGPDSTALLLVLARLAKARGSRLQVAYFDHALRGPEESKREAAFVRTVSASLGLPFSHGAGDVRGRASRDGTSIENAARRERYDFLAGTAREIGATSVATGHTASDQAETVLLHLVRGAGLDGLSGMAPESAWPLGDGDLSLIRPLLCLSREDTVAYCEALGVKPVEDESNDSPDYSRNRIRHEVIPLLRTFNPRIEDALVRLADASRGAAVSNEGGSDLALDPGYNDSPQPEAIRRAIAVVAGDLQGFSAVNVASVGRLMRAGTTGDSVDLPRGLRASRGRDAVRVEPVSAALPPLPEGHVILNLETPAILGHLWLRAGTVVMADADASVEVDAAAVERLAVRKRRPGDRFQPSGMSVEKKLQDFFVDSLVPRAQRDRVPLFITERGIAWVGGHRLAEWAKPRPGEPTVWLSYREAS